MNKKHYIKIANNHLTDSIILINNPNSLDYSKERSQFILDTSKRWLELLNRKDSLAEDVENLLGTIYFREISETGKTFFIPRLFADIYLWAKECNLLTGKSREMMIELFTAEANTMDEYYDNWMTDPPEKHVPLAISIVKKWINMINSDQVIQEDVDRIIDKIISYNVMAGSMFSGLAGEFRLWAVVEGFKVLSEKKLDKHFKKVSEDWIREFIKKKDK